MIELSLRKDNEEVMKYFLNKETTTIGRGSNNDICLPDPSISRTHLSIVRKGNEYFVTDKSTNGTFVNGERISSYKLNPEDTIAVGTWFIRFGAIEEFQDEATQVLERDPTRVLSYQPETRELTFERAVIQALDSPKKTYPVSKQIISIGKSKSNDIILNDPYISTFHCKIEHKFGDFFIRDLGSTNGTLLNGQRVIESSIPKDATIQIGRTRLSFSMLSEVKKIRPSSENSFEGIQSKSPKMRELFALIERVAPSDATVLIQGETGSGKELMARAVHLRSGRIKNTFVALNCGAISRDLIESELFGHERGAFTSAHQQRKGVFEQAHGGTLFLDEVGELPLELQPKLLRVLETSEIKRVGGTQLIDVDVRVIAATHKDLGREVEIGTFREDLFYRLYVVPFRVPPLRDRHQDIPLLVDQFLKQSFASAKGKTPHEIDPQAIDRLMDHTWPGNVRELKNVISRAVLDCKGSVIGPGDLQFAPLGAREQTAHEFDDDTKVRTITRSLREIERERILRELRNSHWNKKLAAKKLGIAKSTLHEKIRKYSITEE